MRVTARTITLSLVGLALAGQGCGRGDLPELASVSGTVTLDGKPLAGAIIAAYPDVGRPAVANIDEQGYYELQYKQGVEGTKLGRNKISFVWPTGGSGPAIPAKWGDQSKEYINVAEGANEFNFALESDPPPDETARRPPASAAAPVE
ncbi:MAG: hypothetical protein JNG89_06450 [Planctomycetaceae bacterium]|nr:hypothetical protein [Planctomycetaceae bacterium]